MICACPCLDTKPEPEHSPPVHRVPSPRLTVCWRGSILPVILFPSSIDTQHCSNSFIQHPNPSSSNCTLALVCVAFIVDIPSPDLNRGTDPDVVSRDKEGPLSTDLEHFHLLRRFSTTLTSRQRRTRCMQNGPLQRTLGPGKALDIPSPIYRIPMREFATTAE